MGKRKRTKNLDSDTGLSKEACLGDEKTARKKIRTPRLSRNDTWERGNEGRMNTQNQNVGEYSAVRELRGSRAT
jgi:hypothetical protein